MPIMLIGIGLVLAIGSLAGAYWMASLGCAMNTTGCDSGGVELFVSLMLSQSGLLFWAPCAAGVMFLLIGLRARKAE